jgi:hypothetical protein
MAFGMNTMFEPPAAALPGADAEAAVLGAVVGAVLGALVAPLLEQAAANNAAVVTRAAIRPFRLTITRNPPLSWTDRLTRADRTGRRSSSSLGPIDH